MAEYINSEHYVLPSKGLIYEEEVNPNITITSMTTTDEMKRLSRSERQYQTLCEIIDSRLVEPIGISSYDLCIGDYAFLLHRLRVATYGDEYKLASVCPFCGHRNEDTISLDDFKVNDFKEEDLQKYSEFELPVTKKKIKIRMQTPRSLDDTAIKIADEKKRLNNSSFDPSLIYNIASMIISVDGKVMDTFKLEEWVKTLPMKDTATILAYSQKLNDLIGMDLTLENKCNLCGYEFKSSFTIGPEFFRPNLDI